MTSHRYCHFTLHAYYTTHPFMHCSQGDTALDLNSRQKRKLNCTSPQQQCRKIQMPASFQTGSLCCNPFDLAESFSAWHLFRQHAIHVSSEEKPSAWNIKKGNTKGSEYRRFDYQKHLKPNFMKFRFQMVWYSNGQFMCSMSCILDRPFKYFKYQTSPWSCWREEIKEFGQDLVRLFHFKLKIVE